MDCRIEKLTADAIRFLEAQRCVPGRNVDEVRQAVPENITLSEAQLTAVAALAGVKYTANCGYRVSFFPDHPGDNMTASISRNSFLRNEEICLGYCDTDGPLDMDDVVISASGALKVLGGHEPDWTAYDSPYVVIERDAFLSSSGLPLRGHANLPPSILRTHLEDRFPDLTLHSAASDAHNAIWYSNDVALVYCGWMMFITLHSMEAANAISIYARTDSALRLAEERLADISIA